MVQHEAFGVFWSGVHFECEQVHFTPRGIGAAHAIRCRWPGRLQHQAKYSQLNLPLFATMVAFFAKV
jgi:hypothetical protein